MADIFPKLMTGTKLQIQEAQKTPSPINTQYSACRQVIFKWQKNKMKRKS